MRARLYSALVGLAALVATVPAAGQTPVRFGVMAGASFANFYGDDVDNTDSRTGFVGGGFLRFSPAGIFAIEPQLLYVQKGATAALGGGVTGTFKLDYIEVPVLVKLNITTSDKAIAPNIFVGPAISFKASCKLKADNGSGEVSTDCGDAGNGIKSTDFSLVMGVGLDVSRLSFQGRYDLGLSKIGDGDGAGDVKNKAFLITVGFAF